MRWFLLMLWVVALTGCGHQTDPDALLSSGDAPLTISYKDVRGSKPPLRTYLVDLRLLNRHDRPLWFIMRETADKPLPPSARLIGGGFSFGDIPLDVRSAAVSFSMPGKHLSVTCFGGDFIAFRLAAYEKLKLDQYQVSALAPTRDYEIWEASDVLIDDRMPLEEWISSRAMTIQGYYATPPDGSPHLRIDDIQSVKIVPLGRWTVPIANLPFVMPDPWR